MKPSFATRYNLELIDEQYDRWISKPETLDPAWQAFFEGFELGSAVPAKTDDAEGSTAGTGNESSLQTRIDGLVYAYRTLGHTLANLDPLENPPDQPLLSLSELGFREADLDLMVSSKFYQGSKQVKLRDLIKSLKETYSSTIGFEFMHIQNPKVRNWVRERIEQRPTLPTPDATICRRIAKSLIAAEEFEHFLHNKYVGQKRFSLEGGESLMVILDSLFQALPSRGVQEIVMGMAHRGRLTVLANFLGKSVKQLFTEFSENYIPDAVAGDGDVKYHLGYVSTRQTDSGEYISIRLAANPSHLEAVDPVVEGMARARQRILGDQGPRKKVIPLLVHGDAAFAGQGIVAEVLNISQLPGYRTGGTIHLVINNQIGFTTLPADARSTEYATDIAKMIEAPIFHVNGDDPLACHFVTELALDFRQTFARDVVVDMICYRRHGHNEGDEPLFTQPDLYKQIDEHPSVLTQFRKKMADQGILPAEETDRMEKEFHTGLETALAEVRQAEQNRKTEPAKSGPPRAPQPAYSFAPVDTNITPEVLEHIVKKITEAPDNFKILPKVKRMLLDRRSQLFKTGGPYDWSFAETLAFGSLLMEGTPVRLSGQDSRRGTFSQRHSVLYDYETRDRHIPLMKLSDDQARFCVYNSSLSEAAILGFDYGYSLDFPEMLCIWEAQFGDFANGAQVIIDQFIASAESKWQRFSGIVMLLPHGYEGQGPEHSSARMERFLQLCAEENMQVCNLTTPAQYFHLLRRQMKRPFRKPLIVMTPKSLLRNEQCVSYSKDFTSASGFSELLNGELLAGPEEIKRVVFCSGKVYYDLLNHRDTNELRDTALIRVEQIYPFNSELLRKLVAPYKNADKWVWCQEESQNMGAWTFIQPFLSEALNAKLTYAGRNASSSPAVGSLAIHKKEQKQLVEEAFTL